MMSSSKPMCALNREILVDFAELRHIEIECSCGTGILVDLTNKKALSPGACPGCHLDLKIKDLLDSFKELYRALTGLEEAAVRLRIPWGPPEAPRT
jgi:hypothetical protein